MGHIFGKVSVFVDTKKLESMILWPWPKTVKEPRGFLGLTWYYRRLIGGYSVIARPLYELLKSGTCQCTKAVEKALYALKNVMNMPTVLDLPNFAEEFVVRIYVFNEGIGDALMQKSYPFAFYGKALGSQQARLSMHKKEMLNIIIVV